MFHSFDYRGATIHCSIVDNEEKFSVQYDYIILPVKSLLAARQLITKIINHEPKYESICNIEHKHKGRWFSPENMIFFKSKLYGSVYCGRNIWYFVSSEKCFVTGSKRLFSVRQFDLKTGDISTKSDFQQYTYQLSAEKAAKLYAKVDV